MSDGLKKRVEAMIERLRREDVCMHGFLLSVGGELKAQAYYAPFAEGQMHRMYSVSKTMTVLAIGLLLDEKKLSLDDRICDYFRDFLPEKPDERLMRMTIREMLPMTTCFRSTAYREGDADWTKPFFNVPSTHEAGTVFYYDTGCSQVLASLVKRVSRQDALAFLQSRVFTPLGADDEKKWISDSVGNLQGGTGLCMSLRDLNTVALCVMRGGQGVLPEWFCREMVKCHVDTLMQTPQEERFGYGWQCWRTRAGYAMYGLGGQLAVCCPDKDTLLTTIADTRLDPVGVQRIYNAFFEEVYPYIGEEDMPFTRFSERVVSLPHDPSCEREHAGVYRFSENMLGLNSLEIKKNELIIGNARGTNSLSFGLGENVQGSFPGWENAPTLSSGGWMNGDKLHIRCFIIGDAPCGIDLLLQFKGSSVTVQAHKSFDPMTNAYEGVASGYLDGSKS